MKIDIDFVKGLVFFRNNWFKIALVFLGFYLFFIKQLSFHIQVSSPDDLEQHHSTSSQEKITENKSVVSNNKLERMELPLISGPKSGRKAMAELKTINDGAKHAYLERFSKVALAEQERYGIPASVILAAALHESCAGKRDMAVQSSNHFALPCSKEWRSACQSYHGNNYRKYESAWASFRDFSKYLDANYTNLKGGNYLNYANAFQNDGFGEDPDIGENLIQIIEGYRLHELDY